MAKSSSLKAAFRQKKGFSLIAVMIISLVNLAIMGVALRFAVSSSGGGRVNSAMAVKYNLLQNALEEGKARLKESMDNKTLPLYTDKENIDYSTDITSSDMLLLSGDLGEKIVTSWNDRAEMQRLGIFGDSGVLTVKIYDMQYDAKKVILEKLSPQDLQLLPPSMQLPDEDEDSGGNNSGGWGMTDAPDVSEDNDDNGGGNGGNGGGGGDDDGYRGVYLIRAALSVYNNKDPEVPIHTWSLETSVIQYNKNI